MYSDLILVHAGGSEDDELIPRLVEQVVVSKVKDVLSHGWDPTSSSSTSRAVGMLQDVMVYISK